MAPVNKKIRKKILKGTSKYVRVCVPVHRFGVGMTVHVLRSSGVAIVTTPEPTLALTSSSPILFFCHKLTSSVNERS